jgi:hypothetical protein
MLLNSDNLIKAFKGSLEINNNLDLYKRIKKAKMIQFTLNEEIDEHNNIDKEDE